MIIAISNQKGGTGKSTSAAALGDGLSKRGYKVLFVDLDAQGNLSYSLGANMSDLTGRSALDVLQASISTEAAIQATARGDIIASSPSLAAADMTITQIGKEYRLKEALNTVKRAYDYVIIDTAPALGILTVNALTAADSVIIPAQPDIFSLQGITQLSNTIDTIKKYCNASLTVSGILLTRYNGRAIISREVGEMLRQTASGMNTKLFEARIRECTALKEAAALRQSIFDYAPRSNAATDYEVLIEELLKEA